jgi:hypothetical protein
VTKPYEFIAPFDIEQLTKCWAGRWADLGGVWTEPCEGRAVHLIYSEGLPLDRPLRLCEEHFGEALEGGFVTNPYVGPELGQHLRRQRGGR